MKKFNQFFLFLVFLIMFAGLTTSESSAQDYYYLNGYQSSGYGTDAALECDGIIIYRTLTVVDINGSNAGFWVTDGSNVLARYWNSNDSDALYLQFEPGTYYVYPNLRDGQSEATVQLVFQEY